MYYLTIWILHVLFTLKERIFLKLKNEEKYWNFNLSRDLSFSYFTIYIQIDAESIGKFKKTYKTIKIWWLHEVHYLGLDLVTFVKAFDSDFIAKGPLVFDLCFRVKLIMYRHKPSKGTRVMFLKKMSHIHSQNLTKFPLNNPNISHYPRLLKIQQFPHTT